MNPDVCFLALQVAGQSPASGLLAYPSFSSCKVNMPTATETHTGLSLWEARPDRLDRPEWKPSPGQSPWWWPRGHMVAGRRPFPPWLCSVPTAPRWSAAARSGPTLAAPARGPPSLPLSVWWWESTPPADESRGPDKGKMKFPLSYLPWLTNPNLPSQDEEQL